MTREQAQDIVALLRAATRGKVDESKATYFAAALEALDYAPALAAANMGTVTWTMFPSWAEFKDLYRAQIRLSESETANEFRRRTNEAEFKRGVAAPEWVWVWSWARGWSPNGRDPVETRPFPQQSQYIDTTEVMTEDEYELLLAEWTAAGAPRSASPLPMVKGPS